MSDEIIKLNCPTCGKVVIWNTQNSYRPFCSKRCQLIDLGEWADEEKRIPSQTDISDSETWDDQSTE